MSFIANLWQTNRPMMILFAILIVVIPFLVFYIRKAKMEHPKGLIAAALSNMGERFGYYTMLAVFALFLRANFGLDAGVAGAIYSTFLGLVYFMPLFGGIMADKFGFGKMVTIGIFVMFMGYLLLALPLGAGTVALGVMALALLLVCVGTGLFKGNLQVLVGNLYDDPKYSAKRDEGFSIFYMAINLGSMFAAAVALSIMAWTREVYNVSKADSYHFAFAVACVSLILSIVIYYAFRKTFIHADRAKVAVKGAEVVEENLTPAQTKERIICLCLVFAVVIFFWMAFHQNGLTLTYFADEFTNTTAFGFDTMLFDVWNLALVIVAVYAAFSIFQSESAKGKLLSGVLASAILAFLVYRSMGIDAEAAKAVSAPIFQQFNPFYVVALTPVSLAIFGALAKRGKEPSAPRKIAYGMLVAAIGFAIMAVGSVGLLTPDAQAEAVKAGAEAPLASANWLIMTYLVLTFAELLLSPMGISFVSKVAPPKYKGMMMGGWFVATAIGNMLVAVGGLLWGGISLTVVWSVFIVLCLLSALFMFVMMKRLESATK